ncbi:MAG: hypothetical protein ABWY63_00740 [Hyphomicrobiaceae bacterium]
MLWLAVDFDGPAEAAALPAALVGPPAETPRTRPAPDVPVVLPDPTRLPLPLELLAPLYLLSGAPPNPLPVEPVVPPPKRPLSVLLLPLGPLPP